jgi:predicted DNA-binding transcriptional regulator YafY
LKAELQRIVYEALMQDMQLRLSYRKRDAASATVYESVHPLGIVQRGQVIYLVCQFGDYDDVRTLALHRIQSAELTYQPARKPKGFSLDAFINSGQMGVKTGDPISLKAVFSRKSGEHLFETPICRNQDLQSLEDGSLQLIATIPHTKELVWWLLGFGDGVTVLEPSQLRDELKTTAQRMVALYQ